MRDVGPNQYSSSITSPATSTPTRLKSGTVWVKLRYSAQLAALLRSWPHLAYPHFESPQARQVMQPSM